MYLLSGYKIQETRYHYLLKLRMTGRGFKPTKRTYTCIRAKLCLLPNPRSLNCTYNSIVGVWQACNKCKSRPSIECFKVLNIVGNKHFTSTTLAAINTQYFSIHIFMCNLNFGISCFFTLSPGVWTVKR